MPECSEGTTSMMLLEGTNYDSYFPCTPEGTNYDYYCPPGSIVTAMGFGDT